MKYLFCGGRRVILLALVASLTAAVAAPARAAGPVFTVSVPAEAGPPDMGGSGLVDSGITLQPGNPVTVTATGILFDFWTPDGYSGPDEACVTCYAPQPVNPYSLVATVGSGEPFFVGSGPTVIDGSGSLRFAFNDDFYSDNYGNGAYMITIAYTDQNAPAISAAATTSPNANGWYNSDVTVHFTCDDGTGSGIPAGGCPPDQVLSSEGTAVSSTAETVTDRAGNTSDPSNVVTVKIDKTPPVVTVPADQTVEATGPAGADISFSGVAASDLLGGALPASCSPPSGSAFPLGTTVVTCTASDAAGHTGSASFSVHVLGAAGQVETLVTLVSGLGDGNLSSSAQAAEAALARGDTQAACGSLKALANKVSAQSGKKLTAAQAAEIKNDVTRISNVVGC